MDMTSRENAYQALQVRCDRWPAFEFQNDGSILICPGELFCRYNIGGPGEGKVFCATNNKLSSTGALRKHVESHGGSLACVPKGSTTQADRRKKATFLRYLVAINDKADGESDPEPIATPIKCPAKTSKRRGQAQAAAIPSMVSNAGLRETPPRKPKRSSSPQTRTDHPVSSIKEEPNDTPLKYSDGREVAEEDIMDLDDESAKDSGDSKGENGEEESDAYELASDEEWEDEGDAFTHVELPAYLPNGPEAIVKDVFAVTFEHEIAEYAGEVDHQIVGIYSDIHDANQAAQKHAREQPFRQRHKERVYGDGTFHSKAAGGRREQYRVDVSRARYIGRKKARKNATAAHSPQ